MKRLLQIVLAIGIGFYSFSQSTHELRSTKLPDVKLLKEKAPQQSTRTIVASEISTTKKEVLNSRTTFVPIGQMGNVYSVYGNSRTYLWADQNTNSVVFTHRMIGGGDVQGNSRIAYDISTDDGETWITNVPVYIPLGPGPQYPQAAGRYPQGGIINPEGNTDPDNAYYTYYIPTIISTNGLWGGHAYGSNVLTETDPSNPTQVNLESGNGYFRLIPDAFTVTQQGVSWYFEPSEDYSSGDVEYTGNLMVGRGEIIDGEVVYEEELIEFLEPLDAFNDTKIAFAPDGQTGYMLAMSDSESDPQPYTSYHPILLKTTDGGDTWSDPIHVQLGGVDGIESVKYYWSDEILESIDIYGPGFNRDEVYYNLGFHSDIIVDGQGNPHITGIIAIGSPDGWYPGEGTLATWHLHSHDGGETWDGNALYNNIFLDGMIGDLEQYNRPYAASTIDGRYLFFSWIDTDLEGAEGNNNPNIFVVGYDSEGEYYSDVQNVTALSLYWYSAFYSSMSQYVFGEVGGNKWDIEIPFVFIEYTVPGDPASEANVYYIDGFNPTWIEGADYNEEVVNFSIAQNTPNPASSITSILVTAESNGIINLSVRNILGQVVHQNSVNNSALAHTFNIDVSNFEAGIYFYTVEIGNSSITKKMVVR